MPSREVTRVHVDTLERAMFALAFSATSRALPTRVAIERRSRRAPTTRALFGKKPASEPAPAAGKSRFNKPAKATEKPAKGEPYLVDGKLWVCQGCGYVYDGQRGAWAEGKRCPMCGERRFALKDPQELQVAIYSLVALVGLLGVLYGLVTLF
ncbi:Rubredoxin-type fold [Ostreococcus tauri]|uniref:Rubredoxin-type fold n=1 Tax=Ostreococcus tauri TaxID=70448 RepID=A0A096P974_OSTTA|nr:Rubredoxin-type fold [Ostreococcus tauri]CEG00568.1 Rubredoxin-type fold [Ostreococcus tauri]|eukprot:XP_022840450.1 Rubredoxin-type fold [Ostreococcus tauri]